MPCQAPTSLQRAVAPATCHAANTQAALHSTCPALQPTQLQSRAGPSRQGAQTHVSESLRGGKSDRCHASVSRGCSFEPKTIVHIGQHASHVPLCIPAQRRVQIKPYANVHPASHKCRIYMKQHRSRQKCYPEQILAQYLTW